MTPAVNPTPAGARSTLWIDVSYTQTQRGSDIGITRTVRRLFAELKATGLDCRPVSFHTQGFREAVLPANVTAGASKEPRDGFFRFITGDLARKLVPLAVRFAPWPLLRPVWQRSASGAFNALAGDAQPAPMQRGDVLLLADASWNYPAWLAATRARAQGVTVVLLVYDLMPLREPRFCFPLVPKLYGTWLARMLTSSDAVVCISKATQDDVAAWAGEHAIALPPTGHFRLGSDPKPQRLTGAPRVALQRHLDGAIPCFAAVGSFEPKKNYGVLLAAFDRLWSRGVQARLVVAGRQTTEGAALVEAMHRHPQNGKLLLTLHDATDAEVMAIYAGSRALVLASLFEGFGLPLVEARTCGCTVIASDLPVFAELADAGVTTFDRHSADSLAEAVEQHLREPMRESVAPMPQFTWADSAAQLLQLMKTLAGSKDTPGA